MMELSSYFARMPETHFGISQSLFQAENLVIPGVEMRPLYLKENKENEANIRQSKTNFGLLLTWPDWG